MTDKSTRLSALLMSFLMLLSLASCSRGGTVEITSAQLIESADGANVKFVLKNNTGADIDKLKITADTFDGENKTAIKFIVEER